MVWFPFRIEGGNFRLHFSTPGAILPNRSRHGNEVAPNAKADWQAGRFAVVPGDAEEFIPLPER